MTAVFVISEFTKLLLSQLLHGTHDAGRSNSHQPVCIPYQMCPIQRFTKPETPAGGSTEEDWGNSCHLDCGYLTLSMLFYLTALQNPNGTFEGINKLDSLIEQAEG